MAPLVTITKTLIDSEKFTLESNEHTQTSVEDFWTGLG